MTSILIELSKYFMILCIAFYTLHGFIVFKSANVEDQRGYFIMQNVFMIFIHAAGYLVLALIREDTSYLIFYAIEEAVIIIAIILFRSIYPKTNQLIINNMSMLLSISFVMMARLSTDKCHKQFIIVVGGLVLSFLVIYLIRYAENFFMHFTHLWGIIGITMLSIVLVLGSVTNGSKISFTIHGITFQPSEIVKILFVFFVAAMYTKSNSFAQVLVTTLFAVLHIGVLALSKDLGSALIFFVVYIVLLYVATNKLFYLIAGLLAGAISGAAGYKLFSHVRTRVIAWKDPFSVIDGQGYQITQSLFAIGTGGWFGMGLGQGSPNKIPVVCADFIFSAIAEEMGCIFAIFIILICISNFLMFINIALRMKKTFYKLSAVGFAVIYGFQMFLTIGGVTKFIPLTGVTLPLVSYGGTSVIVTLIMFSIIQGFYILRDEPITDKKVLKPVGGNPRLEEGAKPIEKAVAKQSAAAEEKDAANEVNFEKIDKYTQKILEDEDFEFYNF